MEINAIEIRPLYTRPDSGAGDVVEYLDRRKRVTEMRIKVISRFDKLMNQVIISGSKRVKGMNIQEAFERGSRLIETADYYFLIELRNIPRGNFLSALFDSPSDK